MQRFRYKSINGVHSIRPNQQCSAFSIATSKGVKVFSMDPLSLRVNIKSSDVGSCTTAELLNESSLIALVGGGGGGQEKYDEKAVVLKNMETGEVLLDITFDDFVLAIRFSKEKMAVVLPEEIHVFQMGSFKNLQTIKTGYNHNGLCEVSDNGVMIFPAPNKGHVQVVNLNQLKEGTTISPVIINAHKGVIASVAICHNGSVIATASEKGTLVRIFDVTSKKIEVELRRGLDTAVVYNMVFSSCDGFLGVCSDKGTVHIFAVKETSMNKTSILRPVGNILPEQLGKPLVSQKSLAQFDMSAECPCVLAFVDNQTIIAIGIDGSFQKYAIHKCPWSCKRKILAYTLDMGDDFSS